MKKTLLSLFTLCILGCGSSNQRLLTPANSSRQIIGGDDVNNSALIKTVTVKLYFTRSDSVQVFCSGTLISQTAILTAAHCLRDVVSGNVTFFDGSHITDFTAAIIHPKYDRLAEKNRHDFAILKFKKEIPIQQYAQLPSSLNEPRNGAAAMIAGFGKTSIDDENAFNSFELKSLDVQISDINFSDSEVEINEGHDTGACHGDSGGPGYIISWGNVVVWGVDSRNSPKSQQDCTGYELYSRALTVKDWIQQNIANP